MSNSTAVSLTLPSITSGDCQQLLQEKPLLSLYEAFATIADPRSKHGQRYELPSILVCLGAALLCNCNSTLAIGQWCRDQKSLLTQLFGARDWLCPDSSLYRKLLPRLDAEQIESTEASWIRSTLQAKPDDPISECPARRFAVPKQMNRKLLNCSPSAHMRAKKRCCKPPFPKRPMRSLSRRNSCHPCL